MVVVTGLMVGAAAVGIVVSCAGVQGGSIARPPGPLTCSPTDRRSIVKALGEDYTPDVAATVGGLRCGEAFAYGTVCLLCGSRPPGAIFGVLLKKEGGEGWRYLGSGDLIVIERLADDAGLERSDLDQLRGRPPP